MTMVDSQDLRFGDQRVPAGTRSDIDIAVTESYSGVPVRIPIHVWRAAAPGPIVFVTAAVHGDEVNGTGIVRALILDPPFKLETGALVLAPVVNMLGFDRHARYLPDRRDLNRCFPGFAGGSLAGRYAATVFHEIVKKCDYGIDLHTAAVRRTNFPNVRANLKNPEVRRIADAFGCELVINSPGPKGSLRRSASHARCPTIILEAGEVWKIESGVVQYGVRGIRNVLIELGMVNARQIRPPYQAHIEKTKWIRAESGGVLQFHVAPGDVVDKGQAIATNATLLGREQNVIHSPCGGIVLGMTTLPAVTPGDPICHIAIPPGGVGPIRAALDKASNRSLRERLRGDLATSMDVSEHLE
jgi:predicted deacylase